jgi:hypothetical protein
MKKTIAMIILAAGSALAAGLPDVILSKVGDTCSLVPSSCAASQVGIMIQINTRNVPADSYLVTLTLTAKDGSTRTIRKGYAKGENQQNAYGWEFTYVSTGEYDHASALVQPQALDPFKPILGSE